MLAPLFSAAAAFILWPIEYFLPYPHMVEEIAKAMIILITLGEVQNKTERIKIATLSGLMFAVSETILYLFNIYATNDLTGLLNRLLFTIPLHIITFITIVLFYNLKKKYIVFGLSTAIVIHYIYNSYITTAL